MLKGLAARLSLGQFMSEKLGSPYQPLEIKCCSIGRPGDGVDYICFVTQGKTEIYIGLRDAIEALLLHQLRAAQDDK
jgi:hypothetical protein